MVRFRFISSTYLGYRHKSIKVYSIQKSFKNTPRGICVFQKACSIVPFDLTTVHKSKSVPLGHSFSYYLLLILIWPFGFTQQGAKYFHLRQIYLSVYDLQQYIIYLLNLSAVVCFSKERNNLTPCNISCTSKGSSSHQPVKCSPQDLMCQNCYSGSSDVPNDPWTCEQVWRIMRSQMLVTDHSLQSLMAHRSFCNLRRTEERINTSFR